MHKLSPADELAEIRAEITRLKAREAVLRDAFLQGPAQPQPGRWSRVEVVTSQTRVFDSSLLPPSIKENPRYWKPRITQIVRCLPLQIAAPRPGWPIRREGDARVGLH